MSELDTKRYYWIKLEKDFFKRHDIRIVESMPNGKDYILFYLKLLCESTSHEGYLRFSEAIPYSIEMLSTITNTNVDVVRSAIEVFSQLKMMSVMDDGTLFLQEVAILTGSETHAAIRKREYREEHKKLVNGTMSPKCPQELDIELDIDKEKDKELKKESVLDTDKKETIQPAYDSCRECLIQTFLPKGIMWSVAHDKMLEQWLVKYTPEFINNTVMEIALDSDKIGKFNYLNKVLEGKWLKQFQPKSQSESDAEIEKRLSQYL